MLKIKNLDFGHADAQNYKMRSEKEKFNKWFIRTDSLEKICSPVVSFVIGEKGTGKTAYAVYFNNTNYKAHQSSLKYIRETDYLHFINLKKQHQLGLSDYTTIWKVILFMLLSDHIIENEQKGIFGNDSKFRALIDARNEYYNGAFSPEVADVFEFITNDQASVNLITKFLNASYTQGDQAKVTTQNFRVNLMFIRKQFEDAFKQLKLKTNFLLFIDGIDFRPSNLEYSDYLECIKGLAHAIWDLNTDFFPSIKDTQGRCKIVLLTRPDIFNSIGLQNHNAKLKDNSVILNWIIPNYNHYKSSELVKVIEQILKSQNENDIDADIPTEHIFWNHYFPWKDEKYSQYNQHTASDEITSFISFLRLSYHKPRDILTMLKILQASVDENKEFFSLDDLENQTFKRAYSEYLLGEIKDQLSFYYRDNEYELFIKFFEYLDGNNKFSYEDFSLAFNKMLDYLKSTNTPTPKFMSTTNEFLQFLYELNIICYIEDWDDRNKTIVHWCFRERSPINISPKITTDASSYEIFYGLRKALNVEIPIKKQKNRA